MSATPDRWRGSPAHPSPTTKPGALLLAYLTVVVIAGAVVLDNTLPSVPVRLCIAEVLGNEEDANLSRSASSSHWVVVRLQDGHDFQTDQGAAGFIVGDTLDLELSPWFSEVMRYRTSHPWENGWQMPPAADRDARAYPILVLVSALLLLVPWRKDEVRWIFLALLFMGLAGWMFNLVGTGILRRWL